MSKADFYDDYIDEDELVEDTEINRYELDVLWENHSAIHNKWSRRFRKALKLQEKYTTLYRLKKAELFRRCREGEYDIEGSMTDAAVKNWVENHPEYIKLLKKRNKYDALVNMLQGIMYSINKRGQGLEEEVKLWKDGYFSKPRIPNSVKEEVEKETHKAQREKLNKKMKNRKKTKKRKEAI